MRIVYGCSLLAALALAGTALAQKTVDPDRPDAPARPAAAAPARGAAVEVKVASADQQIAALLANCCKNQVEISKFAQDRLQSDSAKQFAEKMVADHTEACEKLAKFAGNTAGYNTRLDAVPGEPRTVRPGRGAADQPGEERREGREEAREEGAAPAARDERREGREEAREDRRENRDDAPRPVVGRLGEAEIQLKAGGDRAKPEVDVRLSRGAGAASQLNWVSIHKEIGDQCLASLKQEFGAKEGAELDHCYIGQQIGAHMMTLCEIKVLRKYASAELRQELDNCVEHCTAHLEEAKTIAKQLEASSTPRVSSKPELKDKSETKPE